MWYFSWCDILKAIIKEQTLNLILSTNSHRSMRTFHSKEPKFFKPTWFRMIHSNSSSLLAEFLTINNSFWLLNRIWISCEFCKRIRNPGQLCIQFANSWYVFNLLLDHDMPSLLTQSCASSSTSKMNENTTQQLAFSSSWVRHLHHST